MSIDMSNPTTVQSEEVTIAVSRDSVTDSYDYLSIDPSHPRYYLDYVNARDSRVVLHASEPPSAQPPPGNLPIAPAGPVELINGSDDDPITLTDADYVEALDTLREIDDVNIVAIPDRHTTAVQQAMIAHCELIGDRFAVIDCEPNLDLFGATGSAEAQRRNLDSTRGYGAYYFPWLRVPAPRGAPLLVPPSGHVCGVMARVDTTRGVHKAPANEIVNGAIGVETDMTNIDQGELNGLGINAIRVFPNRGRPTIWGARTTATDSNWQYVNIRRLFLFLEESIQEGIEWALFEPNELGLWNKLRLSISEFLNRAWRDGALFGATPEDAYYVRIDEDLNPPSERALGRLYIEIGVAPSYPAEFIIVRIGIWRGGVRNHRSHVLGEPGNGHRSKSRSIWQLSVPC